MPLVRVASLCTFLDALLAVDWLLWLDHLIAGLVRLLSMHVSSEDFKFIFGNISNTIFIWYLDKYALKEGSKFESYLLSWSCGSLSNLVKTTSISVLEKTQNGNLFTNPNSELLYVSFGTYSVVLKETNCEQIKSKLFTWCNLKHEKPSILE